MLSTNYLHALHYTGNGANIATFKFKAICKHIDTIIIVYYFTYRLPKFL